MAGRRKLAKKTKKTEPQICRACRKTCAQDSDTTSIFTDNLNLTLTFLTGIRIPESANGILCVTCRNLLEEIDKFREICLESAIYFEQIEQQETFEKTFPDEHGYVKVEEVAPVEEEETKNPQVVLMRCDAEVKQKVENTDEEVQPRRKKVKKKIEEVLVTVQYEDLADENKKPRRVIKAWTKFDYYCCHFCPEKKFKNKDVLRHHLYQNHFQPIVICDFCNAEFQGKYKLSLHMQNCHMPNSEKNTRQYTCAQCDTVCEGYKEYRKHRMTQHYKQSSMVACDECGKTMKQSSLRFHKERVHSEDKTLNEVCEICGARFRFKAYLKTHMSSHTQSFTCPHCCKLFSARTSLREHIKYSHTIKEPEATCEICKKSFLRKKYLKRHMECHQKLPAPRPPEIYIYPCDECEMRFQKVEQVNKHKKIHERKRLAKLTCKYCMKVCRSEHHLTRHQHRHNETWPLSCPICAKGFALTRDLDNHIRVHKIATDTVDDEYYESLIESVDQPTTYDDVEALMDETVEEPQEISVNVIGIPKIRPPKIKVEVCEEDY